MSPDTPLSLQRFAAATSLAGALLMMVGAALWGASGTDLWAALDADDVAGYLTAAADAKRLIVANLSVWMVGVLVLGVGMDAFTQLDSRLAPALVARTCIRTAVPLAVVAFLAMMVVVVQESGPDVAEVVAWLGARADDVATALIVGLAPLFIGLAGRTGWVPTWLLGWSVLSGAVGVLSLASLYLSVPSGVGFAIIPVGLGWVLAAGTVLLRQHRRLAEPIG